MGLDSLKVDFNSSNLVKKKFNSIRILRSMNFQNTNKITNFII